MIAALLSCSGIAAAESITLKGFYADMTADEFIAHGKSLGAVNIIDNRPRNIYEVESVTLEFVQCLNYAEGLMCEDCVCLKYSEESKSPLTLGGAEIELVSWRNDTAVQSIGFRPIKAYGPILRDAMYLKFGRHDKSVAKKTYADEWTEHHWIQDIHNHMVLSDPSHIVRLIVDMQPKPDADDF